MNNQIIEATRVLLSKNIPFSIYRFPFTREYHLSITPELLPHPVSQTFWMAPFVPQSVAPSIFLKVVQDDAVTKDFIHNLENQARRPFPQAVIPAATTKDQYYTRIGYFLNDIRNGELNKAIFSRVIHEEKPKDFNPVDCFIKLTNDYPKTFAHLSLHPDSGIWMGATPELLLKKRGSSVDIMALAGTQARKPDSKYEWRHKEMEEHLMVGRHIEATFRKYRGKIIKKDGPQVLETGKVAHLKTDYSFEVGEDLNIQDFLNELHPTPAVGGLPVDKGIQCILEHEGYDRRYYCGFVGQTDFKDSADLYINLRNMQITEDKIVIFAGGGITALSNPDEEWNETVMKSRTMLDKILPKETVH